MDSSCNSTSIRNMLDPFPNSWYNVGHINTFKPGKIYSQKFLGHDIIIFKTKEGKMVVMDAYCPHLGSHLGRDYKGRPAKLKKDCVVCPFHKLTFDQNGDCIPGEAKVSSPKHAKIFIWPTDLVQDMVFVYFHKNKEAPNWKISELYTLDETWSKLHHSHEGVYNIHPQDVQENAADRLHFYTLHEMGEVTQSVKASVEKEHFKQTLILGDLCPSERSLFFLRVLINNFKLDAPFVETNAFGMGLGVAKNYFKEYGIRINHIITATPIDEKNTTVRFYAQASFAEIKAKLPKFLIQFYQKVLTRLIIAPMFKFVQGQDIDIWANKSFLEHPAIIPEDGAIALFRKWCEQFYSSDSSKQTKNKIDFGMK